MAIQDAEAPGGENQQARAGEQNAHDADGERPAFRREIQAR